MNRDFYLGVFGLVFAGAYYVLAESIPRSMLADAVGAHGLPRVYAVLFGALSLILLVKAAIARARGASGDGGIELTRTQLIRAAGMLGIGVFYIVTLPWIGYIPALAALIVATVHYQGGAVGAKIVALAVGGALVFWLLFVAVLDIPQPPGLWPELFAR